MSLDVYLDLPVDSGNPEITAINVYSGNITHNLGEMASALNVFDLLWSPPSGCKAKDLTSHLAIAISALEEYPDYYNEFNAANSWGTREQFIPWLKDLLEKCEKYPNSIFHSTR